VRTPVTTIVQPGPERDGAQTQMACSTAGLPGFPAVRTARNRHSWWPKTPAGNGVVQSVCSPQGTGPAGRRRRSPTRIARLPDVDERLIEGGQSVRGPEGVGDGALPIRANWPKLRNPWTASWGEPTWTSRTGCSLPCTGRHGRRRARGGVRVAIRSVVHGPAVSWRAAAVARPPSGGSAHWLDHVAGLFADERSWAVRYSDSGRCERTRGERA